MTTAPTPHLRALAEAAEGNGEHIYTHPRDSNKWRENEAWHRAASPGAVLHLLDSIHELEMQVLDLASENSILKRAETDELEARKPLPLSDDEIIAAQEALALSRSRIGLPCTRCETGKYRADRNAYHDFHRCDSCMHVPMWGEDGKELGPPTCTGETS
ncbi:hypothetical protein N5C96_15420 [Delftia tsuruhatensis]|uniref:hypothetical protein n=1 Tax=Delftia tsuruhatensis TaxID=180282 RepID=UPI002444E884|nr:hypothetical protein [Delftia tsuruhatensis]MDH0774787.1 hypothetical protein [Delftia tsuruhatensis]MDH1458727.1 hypothetical protein [Delftia tsuruhatensis]MDH1824672.1 hypothetical protein [Delftia tsuruhatensis]WGG09466.1 hypothetical protein N5O86_22865 [Delftia tsuruhatensis]